MRNTKSILTVGLIAMLLAGCANWRFEARNTVQYINDWNDIITVELGNESRTTKITGPTGEVIPYQSRMKARVTFPGGFRFIGYDVPSGGGTLYRSDDGEWELLAVAPSCRVIAYDNADHHPEIVFEGVMCSQEHSDVSRRASRRLQGERVLSSPHERTDSSISRTTSSQSSK